MRPLGKRCLLYLWNFFFFVLPLCPVYLRCSLSLLISHSHCLQFFSGSPYVHRHFVVVVVVVVVVAVVGLLVSKLGCTALPS